MYYDLKRSTFVNFVWINHGALFQNPVNLNLEMVTPGAIGVEVYKSDGVLAGKADRPNAHGGWSSFYFAEGWEFPPGPGLPKGSYKIKIVNRSTGTKILKHGDLEYGT